MTEPQPDPHFILGRFSRSSGRVLLPGRIGAEQLLVEVDQGARMKLCGTKTGLSVRAAIDQGHAQIAAAAARLYAASSIEPGRKAGEPARIIVTALDLD